MRTGALTATLILLLSGLNAQLKFQNLRYNETYEHMKQDTTVHWYRGMKHHTLGKNPKTYLSQGGEIRYLYQYYKNEDWGDIPVKQYISFYTRFLYHSDLHFSKKTRLFTQLTSTFANGRVTPNRPIDENRLDLHQVFFDFYPTSGLTVRIGRQELLYGSQRLIAVREGPNNRQSYDAAKVEWKRNNIRIDAYYSSPVRTQQGVFDDRFNNRENVWSAYAVLSSIPFIRNIDLYYIGYSNQQKTYNSGTGKENRHSMGTRIWGKSNTLSYDFEALYQFGKWGKDAIRAYTASIDINYTFEKQRTQPTIGLKTEIISGDDSKTDNVLNTFNPLFPRGAYFGLAALIGPSNLIDLHPSISLKPVKKLEIAVDYDIFWRQSKNDGIYGPNVVLIYGSNSGSRFIGNQLGMSMEYQPNPFLKLTPEMMWFFPGPYLKDVSPGKEVLFAAFTAQLRF